MDIKLYFTELVQRYSQNTSIADSLWSQLEKHYTEKKRHYHTLKHIESLINELNNVPGTINDWDTLMFSVFYHDIVYNVLKSNNEEKSAHLAVKQLSTISFPAGKMDLCKEQILATKTHELSINNDTNLFTDADLSILGKSPEVYNEYVSQIRKEYSLYPDMIYKPGRKKVLKHFLTMERIYKTEAFRKKYELQARENLQTELSRLG